MLGGKDWGNKKKVLIVLAFELLTLIVMAIILIPGSSSVVKNYKYHDEKMEKDNFWVDLKRYQSALAVAVVCKLFAFIIQKRPFRIGLEVLATLLFSYWIVGSYTASGYLFVFILFILIIPFIPVERWLKINILSQGIDHDDSLRGGFWPNRVFRLHILPGMRNG